MRLIDADTLKESWYRFDHRRKLTECIDEQPTVDFNHKGKWIYHHWCVHKCSECGFEVDAYKKEKTTEYCSNCGAKMST